MDTQQQKIGTQVVYNLTGLSQSDRNRFCRKFLGWSDKSQYSKYTYNSTLKIENYLSLLDL